MSAGVAAASSSWLMPKAAATGILQSRGAGEGDDVVPQHLQHSGTIVSLGCATTRLVLRLTQEQQLQVCAISCSLKPSQPYKWSQNCQFNCTHNCTWAVQLLAQARCNADKLLNQVQAVEQILKDHHPEYIETRNRQLSLHDLPLGALT